ncbi:uncharacterized protein LOC132705617 [Cylas formicarius]|uniref:uncharacterized protein LOC132705617 n=1 Tax=Cylas formicarius TaxID=197179 RepID=UPI002958C928|nr:uncharacterized protein LOC132705617 [Cylas formicarius]
MKKTCPFSIVLIVAILWGEAISREISCGDKLFVCYDENRFLTCVHNERGPNFAIGYTKLCPSGLICSDFNGYECEERVTDEYLTDEKYLTYFDVEYRKKIIDD